MAKMGPEDVIQQQFFFLRRTYILPETNCNFTAPGKTMVGPNDSFLFEVSAYSQVSGRVGFWPTKVEVENPPSTQGAGSYLCVVRSRKPPPGIDSCHPT